MSPPIRDGSGDSIGSIRLGDGSEIAEVRTGAGDVLFSATTIPDRLIHQFLEDNITVSDGTSGFTWPDNVGGDDMTVTGATYDESLFGGAGGVSSDGSDDRGTTSTMGSFGSNLTGTWGFCAGFSTTDTGSNFSGVRNSSDDTQFLFGANNFGGSGDTWEISLRDASGDALGVAGPDVSDGDNYAVLFQKTAVGGDADDIDCYVNSATNEVSTTKTNGSFSDPSNFDSDMGYFAFNDGGSFRNNVNADWYGYLWSDEALNQSAREYVFDQFPW
jgi:hypothetical protein